MRALYLNDNLNGGLAVRIREIYVGDLDTDDFR